MNLKPITRRPTTVKPIYACPACGTFYHSMSHAQSCRDNYPLEEQFPGLKVGDVVEVRNGYGYGWFNQQRWVCETLKADPKHTSHFRHIDMHSFFYVVTAIHHHYDANNPRMFSDNRRGHVGCVSMVTKALDKDDEEPRVVWNTMKGHCGWKTLPNQKQYKHLVDEVRHLLGKQSTMLL